MTIQSTATLLAGIVFGLFTYDFNAACQEPVAGSSADQENTVPPAPTAAAATEETLEECQDGVDNDGDTYIDCQDQDCWVFVACFKGTQPSPETTTPVPTVPAVSLPKPTGRVEFVSDKPGVSVKKVVAEGFFYSGAGGSGYAMLTKDECLTPCGFDLEKGSAYKFVIGRGPGSRTVHTGSSDLLMTYQVRKNYPALFLTGIIGLGAGFPLVLVSALLSLYKTENWETGEKEPLVDTGVAAGMGAAGGVLVIYGIIGIALGIGRVKQVN